MNPSPSFRVAANQAPPADPSGSKRVRLSGWVLIVLGPGLSVTMAYAARELFGTMASDRLLGRPSRWHGSPEFTGMTVGLFGAVFLIGAIIFLGGIYQIRTGRRSRVLIVLTLGLAAVAAGLVYGIVTSPDSLPR